MKNNIDIDIIREKKVFDQYLKNLLSEYLANNMLDKALVYGIMNGGKRIRPYLIKQFSQVKKISKKRYLRLSVAVELIHSYSLIHDDLPSMDNDDFRRGKPSVHKKFNEAQAILAGDSAHDLAFEIMSDTIIRNDSVILLKLINCLSRNLGSKGLAGGQSLDLLYENKSVSLNKIVRMYKMKTGALFKFCCIGPFIMAGASKKEIKFASEYGSTFGLIFQILDDYLDVYGKKENIGKTPGKDNKQRKSTILNYYNNKKSIHKHCLEIFRKFNDNNLYYLKKWPKLNWLLIYLIEQLK